MQSFFGRASYIYKDKYLAEANFRYDGTSRIHPDYRWGFFPSFSAGWRISNEEFAKDISWLDNMKLRASYGTLGNQDIDLYPYQDVLSLTSYALDGTLEQGVYVTSLTDESLRWETTTITDIGLDFSMKKGLFSFVFDAYKKVTSDILFRQDIPASVGLGAPMVNYGAMQNLGIDLELGHRRSRGDLSWELTGVFSAYNNKILKLLATDYPDIDGSDPRIQQEGLPWDSYYVFEWIGVYQDEEEISSSPTPYYAVQPGDLKFKDQDEDGDIDGDDRIVVDGAHPNFTCSLNGYVKWKNFDLNIFLQAVQGRKIYADGWGMTPFTQAGPPPVKWRDRWTDDNHTNEMPALFTADYLPNMGMKSTFFLQDASYLRIKTVNIGYTIPKHIVEKVKLERVRIYLAADNLFTFTKYEGLDPERLGNNNFAQYPQVRVLSGGINLSF